MRVNKTYSVTRLITIFLSLLFLATVLLSVFFFISFTSITYNNNLDYFKTSTEKSAVNLSNELIQAKQQLIWIARDVGNEAFWITEDPYEQMLYKKNMNSSLYGILHNTDIVDGAIIIQTSNDVIIECHTMEEEAFLKFLESYNSHKSIQPTSPSLFSVNQNGDPSHLVMRQPITGFYRSNLYSQTVANAYLTIPLVELLDEPKDGSMQCLCVASGDFLNVYYVNGTEGDTLPVRFSLSDIRKNAYVSIDGVEHIAILETLNYGDMYLLCLLPRYLLIKQMKNLMLRVILLVLLVFAMTIVGILSIRRLINRPVRDVVNEMQRIIQGDYAYRLRYGNAKEMKVISDGVNDVLDELEERTVQMTETQKNLYELRFLHRESQILALQSQINPHFLYNTLECVRSIAQSYRVPEISKILSAMIRIYRYSASNNNMGTIESEFQCGENYAEIMQVRFGDRYYFRFEIDDSVIVSTPLPRMVLQPLLENAVNHGYADRIEKSEISVRCFCKEDTVILCVRDEGQGISVDWLAELRKRLDEDKNTEKKEGRIGLYNVHQRLKREFGESYGLTIESTEGKYTEVAVRIPAVSAMVNESYFDTKKEEANETVL